MTAAARRRQWIVLALYLGLTIFMTWPVAANFTKAIPGDGFDGWQNIWNLWWMREAWLVEHTSAYFSDLLHYPTGADLRFQTMAPFNGLAFSNLQVAVGLLPAYNAATLFSFVMGGYGAYLLALYALRRARRAAPGAESAFLVHCAAFLAGIIYAFSPYHFAHFLGHLQLIVLQWIPFYILYLLRGLDQAGRRPGRNWLADVFKVGLFLILVGLCDWYYVMYCLIFTGLVLLVRLLQRRLTWQGLGMVVAAGALFGVTLSPLLLPMVRAARNWSGSSLLRAYDETITLSADLLAFVTPQVFHPLWGDWAARQSANFTSTPSEYTIFAGFVALILAGIALMAMRKLKGAGFWLLAAATFAVLALGPVLHIAGRTDLLPGGGQIPLPYAILYNIVPFIKLSRSVSRLDVMVMLCLGVAAAFGAFWLMAWRARRRPLLARAIPFLAAGLILFEFLPLPYPISPPDTPAWYERLAAEPQQQAVLNLPANWERPGYLLYQTAHGKPLSTGYITRDDPQTLRERAPVLSHFYWLGTDIHTTRFDLAAQGRQVLHDLLDVRWVVLDRYKMPGGPEREITEAYTQQIFAGRPASFEDQRLSVFLVDEPEQRGPYLILEPGWQPRQTDAAGRPWRGLGLPAGSAGLTLMNPTGSALRLHVTAAVPDGGTLTLRAADGQALPLADCQDLPDPAPPEAICLRTEIWQPAEDTSGLRLIYSGPEESSAAIYEVFAALASP